MLYLYHPLWFDLPNHINWTTYMMMLYYADIFTFCLLDKILFPRNSSYTACHKIHLTLFCIHCLFCQVTSVPLCVFHFERERDKSSFPCKIIKTIYNCPTILAYIPDMNDEHLFLSTFVSSAFSSWIVTDYAFNPVRKVRLSLRLHFSTALLFWDRIC